MGISNPSPIPINAKPTVPTLPQLVPKETETTAQITIPAARTTQPEAPLTVAAASGHHLIARSNEGTASQRAGGGFYSTGHATAGSRIAHMWLDADGGNFSGSDYFYIHKKGDSGEAAIINQSTADLKFATAGTTRITISGTGKVGIGTAPTNAGFRLSQPTTGEWAMNVIHAASSGVNYGLSVDTSAGAANTVGCQAWYPPTGSMIFTNEGKLGIGTTSPAYELHVADTATETAIAIQSNIGGTGSAVGGRLRLQLGAQSNAGSGQADAQAGDALGEVLFEGQGTDYSYQGGALRVIVSTGDGTATRDEQGCDMTFGTIAVGANSQAEKMRLTAAGKVGIGTNAPTEQLDIRAGNNYVKIGEGSNSISQIEMSDSNPIFIQGWGSEIRFATGTYNNHKMTIQAGGNVGIGTTSPGSTLTVNGSVSKSSGSFRIPHPLDSLKETKDLVHSFIEGPQADLIYRGKVDLSSGTATVNIDTAAGMTEGTFAVLCDDVQCFTTNEYNWDLVKASVSGNTLTITSENSSSTATISWLVIGERKDPHMIDTEWTDTQGKVIVEPDQISE